MRKKINIFTMSCVLLIVLLSGCPSTLPGSRPYTPLPKWERQFFEQARRVVYPDDVRKSLETYKDVLIVWPGVIKTITVKTHGESRFAYFVIEHHYFDWIEDNGIQREKFFLSPRGEGIFELAWLLDTPGVDEFINQFAVGDMIIAYGYPYEVTENLIRIDPTRNIRPIKPQWYRTDVLDYGRPGEPTKTLKVPF